MTDVAEAASVVSRVGLPVRPDHLSTPLANMAPELEQRLVGLMLALVRALRMLREYEAGVGLAACGGVTGQRVTSRR